MKYSSSISILFSLLLASCSFKASPPGGNNGAPFVLDQIKVNEIDEIESNSLGLVSRKVYTLQTCVRDAGTMEKMIGSTEKFTIRSEDSVRERPLDREGCFEWQEEFCVSASRPRKFGGAGEKHRGKWRKTTRHLCREPMG